MPPTINTDGISDEQKNTEKFKSAYQEMYALLTEPGFVHAVCCHEAAHVFYFTMAGAKNYNYFPARLSYDPVIDDYGGTMAAVQPLDFKVPATEEEANQWLWTLLKAHAAGGVISRKVNPNLPDHGDQDDKSRFLKLCTEKKMPSDPEALWRQVQEAVSKQLVERPEILAGLEKYAEEELRPLLGLG